MFEKFKDTVCQLARQAVVYAEMKLGSKTGAQKKELAIQFVMKNLPVPELFKPLVSKLLSNFIDETIEFAVLLMKTKLEINTEE